MRDQIEIVSIAHGGLLIKYQEVKLLIDGIYALSDMDMSTDRDFLTPIPEDILYRIVNGVDEFENLDCLLFTHFHGDHFNSQKTIECFAGNRIKNIFLPRDLDPDVIAVEEKAKELGINVFALDLPFGEWEEQIVENIQIKYFKAAHSGGKEFSGVAHYCYLISIGEKRIYIAGDADYSDSYQQTMLAGEHVTIGFFNPLYFHFKAGRKLISQINPKRVVMYHIPLENNDKYSFRNLSQRSLERFRENLPPCEIISEEMQKFTI